MQSIGFLFKVLWSPGETMFRLSKTPRVLTPLLFFCLFSIVTGGAIMAKLDSAELAMRAIEKSRSGAGLSDEQKAQIRQRMNSTFVKGLTFASAVIGSLVMIVIVAAIYFALFTIIPSHRCFSPD
jgi:hypothetical protein